MKMKTIPILIFSQHPSAHGLAQDALHNVIIATLLSRLLYVSPSWWGMLMNV